MSNEDDELRRRAALIFAEAASDTAGFAMGLEEEGPSLVRVLAFLLRHGGPPRGVAVDAEGWANLRDVARAVRGAGQRLQAVNVRCLEDLVRTQDSGRFEIRPGKIRALYGHSLPGVVAARPASPPARLFHGTSSDREGRIREHGLRPMRRAYVHLTSDLGYALGVARAAGGSWIVLRVRSAEAAGGGAEFLTTAGHVWLTGEVSSIHIDTIPVARG